MYKFYTRRTGMHSGWIHKFLLIMRITTVLLITAFMQVSAASYAQRITMNQRNVSLERVFIEIRKQSGYDFVFDNKLMQKAKPVSIQVSNASIEQALRLCFEDQPFEYTLNEKTIVVKEKERSTLDRISDYFNTITVTGKVVDSYGNILPGVTVTVKGTNKATSTNQTGTFILADVDENATLVFSYLTKETFELKLNGKRSVEVVLKEKTEQLEEVVVNTGYQILKKSSVVGSASSINASEMYLNGINSIEQALQGKLAGVVVTNTSGLTGVRQRTRVRGTSTLVGNQEPIWVVDGIIQEDPLPFKAQTLNATGGINTDNFDFIRNFVGNSIGWLNPNDIEDITVLRDASATAIYGIRAANGVIVITTKRGKTGPMSINYSTNLSTTERVNYDKLNLMNSKERISVSREIYDRGLISNIVNTNIGYAGAMNDYLYNKTISADQLNARIAAMESQNTDWFDILFRKPFSMSHNLNFSGGSNNTSYYSSFGYNSKNGTAIGNDTKGYTANLNMSSRISNKFSISTRLSASHKTTEAFYQVDPYNYASKMNRILADRNSDGSLFFYKNANNYLYNVINELEQTDNGNKVLTANGAIDANYDILPGLRVQTLFSYSATTTRGESYATEQSEYVARTLRYWDYGTVKSVDAAYKASRLPVGGEFNQFVNSSNAWNWRNSISYNKVFGTKHVMALMFGQEFNSSRYTGFSSTNYGYLRDRGRSFTSLPLVYGQYVSATNPLLDKQPQVTDNLTNNMGLYLTGSYAYDDRYIMNVSVRNDRSNRFGQFTNEKFNPVYAGGLKWNVANESWFDRSNWLSTLSIRASMGYQRNISSSVSPDLIVKVPTGAPSQVTDQFTGDALLTISSLPYSDLRWEENLNMNLGFDFSLFRNKVQGTLEYYTKRGRNLISSLNVPTEYGVTTMYVNGGSMNNTGYEATVGFVPVKTRNFTWSVSLNTSKNDNKIIETGTQLATWKTAVSGGLNRKGDPVSGFYAFDFTGVDPATGKPTFDMSTEEGANVISDPTSYMTYVGKMDPDFTSGLGMNFRYKMLSLNSSFYLQLGGKKFLTPLYTLTSNLPTEYQNLSREILDRWTPTNTTSNIPGMPDSSIPFTLLPDKKTYVEPYEMYNYSTDRVVNASSFRCNNINVNYSLSPEMAKKLKCRSISLGGGVSNPFSINSRDYRGIDPEVASGGQPRTRSYTFNLAVTL